MNNNNKTINKQVDKREVVNTPNNIAKGRIEIDSQINKLYYRILYNIQRDNRHLIIKTKKGQELTDEQRKVLEELNQLNYIQCNISMDEIKEIIRRKNDQTEEEIKNRFLALQGASFEFATGEKQSRLTQLIGAVDISEDGYVVNLDAKLYKYLFYSVGIGFTPINLAVLFNLKSQFSQSLYILLRSWSGIKSEIDFKIEELRKQFNVGTKYAAYKNFKQKTINKAIEEINNTGSMKIEILKESKKGRSVDSIIFKVTDYEPRYIVKDENKELEEPEKIYWIDDIEVANEGVASALECEFKNFKPYSPLVVSLFKKAYKKTLAKDKNGETKLTYRNLTFFMIIANGELEANTLASIQNIL
ncbi:replication initiation protein [Clostridium sp.]|uniref:replication initiation protein n=1 Tax=uncultured Clostridium sp. TaxID=59620 RepID=UPI0008210313|nr:replication initiation protein [uncultured Clostridium sp.]SCJ81894.1 Protein involved in initiation of plasmid replication [uncultured Clostridium sp.]